MKCKREIVVFAMKCIEIPAICKTLQKIQPVLY